MSGNDSSTGGYLVPSASTPLPGDLTLTQFIQSVIAGITGITSSLVRPKWQVEPPQQPDVTVDWVAFGIDVNKGDANAYFQGPVGGDSDSILQRQEDLAVSCSFYGPDALENAAILRDGLWVTQNLEAMQLANMGFKGCDDIRQTADLFNERWYLRYDMSVSLVRQVQRTYPVLSFASAKGVIHNALETGIEKDVNWSVE